MQCKDIDTNKILTFINSHDPEWCMIYDGERDVKKAMGNDVSEKLALAKMSKLIKQGLVNGCTCGCRGDFALTEKGLGIIEGVIAIK